MIRRTYGSGSPSMRRHASQARASAVCSRFSASAQSRVSRKAVRNSRGERVTTKTSKPSGVIT